MKDTYTLLIVSLCILCVANASAQKVEPTSDTYRRSSICMILMDEVNMPKRELIIQSFLDQPTPDKYNDHNTAVRYFNPANYDITRADREAYQSAVNAALEAEAKDGGKPKKKGGGGFGKFVKSAAAATFASATGTETSTLVDNADKQEYAIKAHKYLLEQQVAKEMFDRWFLDENGDFSMELVSERGMYDASVMDVETAKSSVRGMGLLADAGEELINNTFVVVSRYRYMSKEELAAEIGATANSVGAIFGATGSNIAQGSTALLGASLGSGYYVRATSFLFQLDWNEDVANIFYNSLWDNPQEYNHSDIFSLKYIGQESAFANVKASIFTNKTEDELIHIATINATDAVLAKLEKKYDVFKTKTPLLTVEPQIMAHIGMKEGVEPGDRYEILEKIVDPETNKTTYKRKGTLKVAKGGVWDNRYMASEERELTDQEQAITATIFEGSTNGLYPGMLLRQIK